ncbi:MAG TPA: hypothetical protein VH481_08385 [Nitrososphaeraceae archaeon]|jgi:hypothetical protein
MPEVKLSITPIEGSPGNYKVQISGSGFEFAANKEVRWKLMDDDPISDDEITDPRGSGVVRSDGTFNFTGNATGENLNDDWGKDEIYAVVSIVGMGTTFEYDSNRVSGNY